MRVGIYGIVLCAGLGLVGVSTATFAEEKATGVVAYRQAVMKGNGDHMAAIKTVLTETPELTSHLAYHAAAIAGAAHDTQSIFPQGSDQAASKALPAVWDKPDEFKAAGEKAEDLAKKLVAAAETGDPKATLAAFATMGKEGCGGCHQNFRKKED